jgi:hypothetical protein
VSFDLDHKVMSSTTELFGFALKETSTEAQYCKAVEEVVGEVLARHPDISLSLRHCCSSPWGGRSGDSKHRQRSVEGDAAMLDTTPITTAITRLISTGTTEEALLAAVAHLFPNLSPAELSQALQVGQAEAERKASRRH